ncbi:MAG: hypothetical protein IJT21_04990 [Synergistaceae bacterium]|nr:hypothetical protein [Synergistaceae bacterium]
MTHEERLADTYRRFPHLRPKDWEPKGEKKSLKYGKSVKKKITPPIYETTNIHLSIQDDLPPEPDIHGDICPHCGHMTLIHESGCVKCTYCDWSACG